MPPRSEKNSTISESLRKQAVVRRSKDVHHKNRSKPASSLSTPNLSPITSPGHSRSGSRVNSRPPSQFGSDDEADGDDEYLINGANSEQGEDGLEVESAADWREDLEICVGELQNRKGLPVEGREFLLGAYCRILRQHVADEYVDKAINDLTNLLLKSVKGGGSDVERITAMQALAITLITSPSDTVWDRVYSSLKWACETVESDAVKAEAIQALGVASVYGGASDTATEELLNFLLEVIETDGEALGATDSGEVVAAALHAWGFVATYAADLTQQAEQAMEAFIEQLDSTDAKVQMNAGSNIALLFEVARNTEEEGADTIGNQYNQHRILSRLAEISRLSAKSTSKRYRRQVKATFASIITSLERGKGPGYSTTRRQEFASMLEEDLEESHEYGYRERVRVGDDLMIIDSWSLQAKVDTLKAVLGGGFGIHLTQNSVVKETLGDAQVEQLPTRVTK